MTVPLEYRTELHSKLSLRGVSKHFSSGAHRVHALDRVSLDVGESEFVCLVGPSGCGKSTLLNIIAGLERADEGQVLSDGSPVNAPGRDRMVMFQEPALFPWLDVMDNVMFGLKLKPNLNNRERREVALFYLKLAGLEKFRNIVFDYDKVPTVGQAFVDEIYRVFQTKYPKIVIESINTNEAVKFMVERVEKPA